MNYLETQVNKLIDNINVKNLGLGWKNHPCRTHSGTYVVGEPFDYCIITKNVKYFFDCKETEGSTIQLAKKDLKQISNLVKLANSGVECFLLIYFKKLQKLVRVDVKKIMKILETRRHIKVTDGVAFNYKKILEVENNV